MNKNIPVVSLFALLTLMPAISHAAQQQSFDTPDQAAKALADANRTGNERDLLEILGPGAADLIHSGDPAADREAQQKFAAAYDTAHEWELSNDGRETLIVGANKWPLPLPLVHEAANKWRFDAATGRQEILDRRIGRNELNVIKVCRAYVEAQADYAGQYPGKHEYAQKFASASGQHDGLYWTVAPGEKESPLGALMAGAAAEDAASDQQTPYHGYYYKILKSQGPHARGGAKDYVVKGQMTGGFALLAYPAKYGDSGIKTFIVNQYGIVHEKDLGPQTAEVAKQITVYDPDKTWQTSSP